MATKNTDLGVTLDKIEHMDYAEYLEKLNEKTVDLVLTDVPYNVTMSNGKNGHGPYMHGKVGLDFGDWDKGQFQVSDYIERVIPKIKDNGQIIIFNSFTNMEEMAWKLRDMGMTVKGIYAWEKTNPMPHMPQIFPLGTYEQFIWAVKDPNNHTFNIRSSNVDEKKFENGIFVASQHEAQNERFHTTQKPLSLWSSIMEVFSNKGDIVMDNFSGSAVNAVSAMNLKRHFLGTELDDNYSKLGNERIQKNKRHRNGAKKLL